MRHTPPPNRRTATARNREAELIRLPDGAELHLRPLRPSDRQAYAEAVQGMSPRSRYLRFASPKPRLSERDLDLLAGVDGHRHLALVALTGDPPRGVGVARYVRAAGQAAEIAIGITDAWQGRGLGRLLLARLLEQAAAHRVPALTATTLAENEASQRLLRSAGFTLVRRDGVTNEYGRRLAQAALAA